MGRGNVLSMLQEPRLCRHCRQPIDPEATICHHCRKDQGDGGAGCWTVIVICIGLIAVLMLLGSLTGPSGDAGPAAVASDMKSKALWGLERSLKDPDSMQVENVVVHPDAMNGEGAVCGWVNAKNAFGGYTGFKRFVVFGTVPVVDSDNENSSGFAAAWEMGDCDR